MRSSTPTIRTALAQALTLLALAVVLGLTANALRPEGLALFQDFAQEQARKAAASVRSITPLDALELHRSGAAIFLDARDPSTFRQGHIPGARNLPLEELRAGNTGDLPTDRRIVVYCDDLACGKSREEAELLAGRGLEAWVMLDGIEGWIMAGGQLEAGK